MKMHYLENFLLYQYFRFIELLHKLRLKYLYNNIDKDSP